MDTHMDDNTSVRDKRRNAIIGYDIARHLPMNQLPPINSNGQPVNPRDVRLPPMSQFMQMTFSNDPRRAHQPSVPTTPIHSSNVPLVPPGVQHPSMRAPAPHPIPGSNQHLPMPNRPRQHLPTHYSLSNTKPIPAHLRVKGIVSSDAYDEMGKKRAPPPSPHPLYKS